MRRNKLALRPQASLLEEGRPTQDYFRERAERGNLAKAKRILKRAGKGQPPVAGDELE